ncbi:MAG: glycyl-radical enzyme activating protein [Bacteroidales bacterium]
MIFNIQRFSLHDGNGIRTIIFFKGCPLRCLWCSNPESQSFGPEIMYNEKFCRNFNDCLFIDKAAVQIVDENIRIYRSKIKNYDEYRNVCVSKALTVSGEDKTADELMEEIEKDLLFYKNGGGVTFSGGEPLSQGKDLDSLLDKLNERNIDIAVETCLNVPWSKIERCIGKVGTFLADIKHTDKEKLKSYTIADYQLIMENLELLMERNCNVIARVPVIPGFNHTQDEMVQIIDTISGFKGIHEVDFLPYHSLGNEKYRLLGRENPFENIPMVKDEEITEYISYAQSRGLKAKTGG